MQIHAWIDFDAPFAIKGEVMKSHRPICKHSVRELKFEDANLMMAGISTNLFEKFKGYSTLTLQQLEKPIAAVEKDSGDAAASVLFSTFG